MRAIRPMFSEEFIQKIKNRPKKNRPALYDRAAIVSEKLLKGPLFGSQFILEIGPDKIVAFYGSA